MNRRSILSVLLAATLIISSTAAFAAGPNDRHSIHTEDAAKRIYDQALGYSFPSERYRKPDGSQVNRIPLGTASYSSSGESPGVEVGATWYEYQTNGSMGRMIGVGPHSGVTGRDAIVHFGWMYLPDSAFESRSYAYNAYDSDIPEFTGVYLLHDPDKQYAGYVNLDVTPDARAVVGGHTDLMLGAPYYASHIYFDLCPACRDFYASARVPDSLAAYGGTPSTEAMWPKFFTQFGTDTVLHVATRVVGYNANVMYFRYVGHEASGTWDYPPYIVDEVQCYSQDITGTRLGDRVGLAWFAGLPYDQGDCDTCSGTTFYDTYLIGQMDNDVYIQMSDDQGVTWQPRQNLTQAPIGEPTFKGYADLSLLFDSEDNFHIVWVGTEWPADTCLDNGGFCFTEDVYTWMDKSRIFHWSEDLPHIRTICDHTYNPSDSCGPPKWAVNVAKMSLSECNGRLYCLWSQFNDIPGGVDDDCALWAYEDYLWEGAANGDLWVSVSADGGLTWDAGRNLTNTYTPRCNPYGGTDCESDYFASMVRYGRENQVGENWSGTEIVVPEGGNATDWYLDIQYVNDRDAGGAIWADDEGSEGSWTYSPIKWFRMPCVEPIWEPRPLPSFTSIADPAWGNPGQQVDTTLTIHNFGNVDYSYTVAIEEDNGPSGWLTVSGFSGFVSCGLANMETGTIHLNTGGIQTDEAILYGRVNFVGNAPGMDPTVEVEFIVTDTLILPMYHTIQTNCLYLACANNGSAGESGIGGLNMDYSEYEGTPVDCDTSFEASVYLYESSVMFAENDGAQWSSSLWDIDWLDDDGLRPQGGQVRSLCCNEINARVFESGIFTNSDTSVAFEKIWMAPRDDCNFIIEYLRVWSFDGGTHTGLTIGEVVDWDIPADDVIGDIERAGSPFNAGGFDPARNLLWMQGYECYCDGDTIYPYNCQYADARFGGNSFIHSYLNGSPQSGDPYTGWVGENDSMWTPAGADGFKEGLMYDVMTAGGFNAVDSVEDLHTGMCFEPDLTLADGEYYEVVTVLATVHEGTLADLQDAIDRATDWYTNKGGISIFADDGDGQIDVCESCCVIRGDANHNAVFNSADVIFIVDFLWKFGPTPVCMDEVDVNCNCVVNSADLLYMVDYFWKGGPPPCPCE